MKNKTTPLFTPGPYRYDSGNGAIESQHEDFYRAIVCSRQDLLERAEDYKDMNIDPKLMPDPADDMEFIVEAMNYYWKLLQERG